MRCLQNSESAVLVDLSNLVARAAAVAPNYLAMVMKMLVRIHHRYRHHSLIYALEGHGTDERRTILATYKRDRVPSPEFIEAREQVVAMLQLTTCTFIRAPQGEADDAIASYVTQRPGDYVVLSNDRDLWQLISPSVSVEAKVKRNTVLVDRFACRRLLGVEPCCIPLYKALLGDPSDQIARAVPRVTKAKLIRLAETAHTAAQVERIVPTASWLSKQDKEKILDAILTVKCNERVTKAWTDLSLRILHCRGDAKKLAAFCANHSIHVDDIETLIGGDK